MKNGIANIFSRRFFVILPVFLLETAHGQLLVENGNSIAAYNFDGTVINPALITGLTNSPQGIAISGTNLYVVNYDPGTIGKYGLDGTVVNASLISGLTMSPEGIAISGTNLYVASFGTGVGKYSSSGALINDSLIVLGAADGIAISESNIFVAYGESYIGKYKLDGTAVNPELISGLTLPAGIAISGTNLYVPNFGSGKIGKYGLDGTVVNASLVSGLSGPNGIAINGNVMYVLNASNGTVGEYKLDGTVINASLISGLSNNAAINYGILVVPPSLVKSSGGNFGVQSNVWIHHNRPFKSKRGN